jgi:hypothetical protein
MLVGQVLKRVDHPSEEGVWFEFRKLPWRKLEEARRATQIDGAGLVKAYGAALIKEIQTIAEDGIDDSMKAAVAAEKAARAQQYDTGVLLRAGIWKWSYSDKPTPDEIDELDDDTAQWARGEILALSVTAKSEADRKNA